MDIRLIAALICACMFSLNQNVEGVTPCCMPKQWSANLIQTLGEYSTDLDSASLAYGNTDYFYDVTGNQIAYRESRDNQTMKIQTKRWVIMNFDQMQQFVIENSTCVTSTLDHRMTPPCIPDHATHFGTHSYPTGIKVDVWFFKDDITGGTKRLGVTQNTCMPLSLSHISAGPGIKPGTCRGQIRYCDCNCAKICKRC